MKPHIGVCTLGLCQHPELTGAPRIVRTDQQETGREKPEGWGRHRLGGACLALRGPGFDPQDFRRKQAGKEVGRRKNLPVTH